MRCHSHAKQQIMEPTWREGPAAMAGAAQQPPGAPPTCTLPAAALGSSGVYRKKLRGLTTVSSYLPSAASGGKGEENFVLPGARRRRAEGEGERGEKEAQRAHTNPLRSMAAWCSVQSPPASQTGGASLTPIAGRIQRLQEADSTPARAQHNHSRLVRAAAAAAGVPGCRGCLALRCPSAAAEQLRRPCGSQPQRSGEHGPAAAGYTGTRSAAASGCCGEGAGAGVGAGSATRSCPGACCCLSAARCCCYWDQQAGQQPGGGAHGSSGAEACVEGSFSRPRRASGQETIAAARLAP